MINVCAKCKTAETVKPLPDGGGSFSLNQLYCQTCLDEEVASGKFDPIQVPLPKN
jgi:hypothetical protein